MKNKMSVIETIQLYILRQTIAKHAKTLKNKDFNAINKFESQRFKVNYNAFV